jgi:DinB family protein
MTLAEIADVLEYSGRAYAGTLRSLPPQVASWHPTEGEWCVKECVGHVIEAEKRAFAGRIRTILGADNPALETWDQAAVEKARHDCDRKPEELLAEFEPLRRESVEMVRSLRPEQLMREGSHPKVGQLTVNDLLHEWVHHDGNHLRQALANVQAYVVPQMGNARRFLTA